MKTRLSQPFHKSPRARRGALMIDAVVAMAILAIAVVPLGFSFVKERQLLKVQYQRAVAIELVDGEMEILAAGAWKNFPDGSQNYSVQAGAATNLPPGHFQLTKTGNHLRLEWTADRHQGIGLVNREVTIQ